MAQLRSQHLGNAVGRDVTLDGSGSTTGSNVWYALPAARREAIGLILLYSDQMWNHSISVTTTKKDNNPNVPLRIATQFLIYEIVCGLRNPTTFESNSTNECGTSGDIFFQCRSCKCSVFRSQLQCACGCNPGSKEDSQLYFRIQRQRSYHQPDWRRNQCLRQQRSPVKFLLYGRKWSGVLQERQYPIHHPDRHDFFLYGFQGDPVSALHGKLHL